MAEAPDEASLRCFQRAATYSTHQSAIHAARSSRPAPARRPALCPDALRTHTPLGAGANGHDLGRRRGRRDRRDAHRRQRDRPGHAHGCFDRHRRQLRDPESDPGHVRAGDLLRGLQPAYGQRGRRGGGRDDPDRRPARSRIHRAGGGRRRGPRAPKQRGGAAAGPPEGRRGQRCHQRRGHLALGQRRCGRRHDQGHRRVGRRRQIRLHPGPRRALLEHPTSTAPNSPAPTPTRRRSSWTCFRPACSTTSSR